jgi:hypothetical protein
LYAASCAIKNPSESRSEIRRILVKLGFAKMVEPPMTEGRRIANQSIQMQSDHECISIFGFFSRPNQKCVHDIHWHLLMIKTAVGNAIDDALNHRTEEAAKIVEDITRTADYTGALIEAAGAIRKLTRPK